MTGRVRHLHDDRLLDCYVAERSGEALDPRLAEHLADCGECAARYNGLAAFMDGLRTDAERESDAVFTPERLRVQQQEIARRIATVGRHARVISFPGQMARTGLSAASIRPAPRWLAAAAAAGIFIGIALGASYQSRQFESHARVPQQVASHVPAGRLSPAAILADRPADLVLDDAFLSDLEAALERPRTRELLAYDAFTPHVREISDNR